MRYLIFLVTLSIAGNALGQTNDWAPVGATWYYDQEAFSPPQDEHYLKIESIKDTVIDGISCRVLHKHLVDRTGSSFSGRIYTFEDSGRVFYASDPASEFRLWLDFTASVGDTVVIYPEKIDGTLDSLAFKVDSVDSINVKGHHFKQQHLSYVYQSGLIFGMSWIKGMGSLKYFTPQSALVDPPEGGSLRCYEDSSIGLVKFVDHDCHYLTTGNQEIVKIQNYSVIVRKGIVFYKNLPPSNMHIHSVTGRKINIHSVKGSGSVPLSVHYHGLIIVRITNKDGLELYTGKHYLPN